MALIGTIKFSELMTWGSWVKKDVIKDIPNPKQVNSSYNKLKKQLENMTETIKKYLMGTIINYGEQGNDNSYQLDINIKLKDKNDNIDRIIITHDKKILISVYGRMYLYSLHEFDIDFQIVIMNNVKELVSKMEKKNRINYKF